MDRYEAFKKADPEFATNEGMAVFMAAAGGYQPGQKVRAIAPILTGREVCGLRAAIPAGTLGVVQKGDMDRPLVTFEAVEKLPLLPLSSGFPVASGEDRYGPCAGGTSNIPVPTIYLAPVFEPDAPTSTEEIV